MKHGFVDKVKWIDTLMSVCPPVDSLEFVTLCKQNYQEINEWECDDNYLLFNYDSHY